MVGKGLPAACLGQVRNHPERQAPHHERVGISRVDAAGDGCIGHATPMIMTMTITSVCTVLGKGGGGQKEAREEHRLHPQQPHECLERAGGANMGKKNTRPQNAARGETASTISWTRYSPLDFLEGGILRGVTGTKSRVEARLLPCSSAYPRYPQWAHPFLACKGSFFMSFTILVTANPTS